VNIIIRHVLCPSADPIGNLIYKTEIVCVFAYSSRTDIPVCTKLGMLIPRDKEEILERPNSEKVSWVRNALRVVSVSWKLSTSQRPRLFLSTRRLQKLRSQIQKLSWVRVPVKMVPVARKLSTIKERRNEQNCLFRRGDYKNKGHIPETLLGSSHGEYVVCRDFFPMILNNMYRMIRPMLNFRAIKIDKKCKHLSNSPALILRAFC
jgi:hypothetical protein